MLVTNQTSSDIYFGPLHLGAGKGTTLTVDDTPATSLYLLNDSVADALNNAYISGQVTVSGQAEPFPRPTGDPVILHGSGDPEGLVYAPQGSVYMRKDGVQSNGGGLYIKTKGVTFSTGWLDLATASGATAVLPPGTITAFGGGTAPDGWLLCDGAAVSRTVYSLLFSAIGTIYGAGDGTSTFNVPNLKGRVMAGHDSAETEFDPLGKAGGEKTHTLTASEMPSHNHGVNDPGHNHSASTSLDAWGSESGGSDNGWIWSPNANSHRGSQSSGVSTAIGGAGTGISIQYGGGGGAHNNIQPYLVVNHIIKT